MSVSYLPKSIIGIMASRCDGMMVCHKVDGSKSSHIVGGLSERLGWLWGKVRLWFHQMWLLRIRGSKTFTYSLMDGRISMLQVDHRSLRYRNYSLLCLNACLLQLSIFFTRIISGDTGRRYPHVTVKICISRSNYLRIHVIAACWYSP